MSNLDNMIEHMEGLGEVHEFSPDFTERTLERMAQARPLAEPTQAQSACVGPAVAAPQSTTALMLGIFACAALFLTAAGLVAAWAFSARLAPGPHANRAMNRDNIDQPMVYPSQDDEKNRLNLDLLSSMQVNKGMKTKPQRLIFMSEVSPNISQQSSRQVVEQPAGRYGYVFTDWMPYEAGELACAILALDSEANDTDVRSDHTPTAQQIQSTCSRLDERIRRVFEIELQFTQQLA